MERLIYQQLINWKANPKRKPLVLNGARQVGKTYILHEFASKEYENVAYFSLDRGSQGQVPWFTFSGR